jgi:hypothetical protein
MAITSPIDPNEISLSLEEAAAPWANEKSPAKRE